MLMTRVALIGSVVLSLTFTAQAKVSKEEAAKLGNELTMVGATKAGNDEGTIPAFDPWPKKGKISGE